MTDDSSESSSLQVEYVTSGAAAAVLAAAGGLGLPPLSNTGVTEVTGGSSSGSWSGLDYLAATFDGELLMADLMAGAPVEVLRQSVRCVHRNYTRQWELYPSGLLFHHPDDTRQGWHVQFKGADLRAVRAGGVADVLLLTWVLGHAGYRKTARLDGALDFVNMAAPVSALRACYERGGMVTRLSADWHDSQAADGSRAWTGYLGARDSDKRLLIYDKARERGLLDVEWTRVEFRFKNAIAGQVARSMIEHGVLPVIRDVAMRTVQFPGTWWADRLGGAGERLVPQMERRGTDTGSWVAGTALPGVLGYLADTYDAETFTKALYGLLVLARGNYRQVVQRDMELLRVLEDAGLLRRV